MTENSAGNTSRGIIDAHVHITTPLRLAGLMRWVHGFMPSHPVPLDVGKEGILSDLEGGGASYFFNLVYPLFPAETESLNRFNHELTVALPRSAGWGSLHQDNEDKAGITRRAILEYGFIGMKFHPFVQKFSVLDPRMEPVYSALAELRRPVFLHTGFDDFYKMSLAPEDIRRLALEYPDMPVVLSHMLYPRLRETFELMDEFPQIIADMTNVPGAIKLMSAGLKGIDMCDAKECELLRGELPRFSGRVIFGSDHPAGMGGYNDIYSDFRAIGLSPELQEDITWNNPLGMVRRYLPGRWE